MIVKRFIYNNLDLREKAFYIRRKVFIEEQKVKDYEEFDAFENTSVHYLLLNDDRAVGTARWRITEGGIKLERFAVLQAHRKKGAGGKLLETMLSEIPLNAGIYLHAQTAAVDFYGRHGFVSNGKEFMECEIPHYKMIFGQRIAENDLTIRKTIAYVHDFHLAFGLNKEYQPTTSIASNLIDLRHRLMHEENEEYLAAATSGDLVEVADALGDMLYILCGTIITHGLQEKIAAVFEEIQRSNMSKLNKEGRPIYREDGKVMKSDQYFRPDIKKILFDN